MLICSGCSSEASPGFAFCPRCGRRVRQSCVACGFDCEADYAFCPRCGTSHAAGKDPTTSPQPPVVEHVTRPGPISVPTGHGADRRRVTVLFADLSGFTGLAERLDAEKVRAFQNALFERLASIITRYDGFVEKFVGDAVLAVFGAPVAHEDDPVRACHAALDLLYSSLDPRPSIETCLRGLETAKKVGDLGFQSRLYANLAVAYCSLTDRCDADGVDAAQTAIDLDRRLGLLDHLPVPLIVLGQIHQCHGDHRKAFAMHDEARSLAEQVGDPQLLFPCYDGLATLYLDAGDEKMAATYLARAQQVCERAGLEPDALMVLPFLC